MPKARLLLISLWALVGYLAPSACAVSDDEPIQEGECLFGPTCGMADSGLLPGTATLVDAATSDQADAASFQGELCGVGTCLPEDTDSCAEMADAGLDAGGGRSDAGDLDASSGADTPAAGDAAPALDASLVDAEAPTAGEGVGSAADASPTPGEAPGVLACQIVGDAEQPERRCLPAGSSSLGEPCSDASECAAGMTCVAESGQGYCMPYCCSGNDACAVGSYCTPRPALRDGHARPVPVCVPADNCSLDEPFPCAGDGCVCHTGTTCTVVRRDGTTSCVAPGRGLDGDECPCAAGYFCSPASGTCLQICELAGTSTLGCIAGHCQMVAGFPEGWGLCVGATAER